MKKSTQKESPKKSKEESKKSPPKEPFNSYILDGSLRVPNSLMAYPGNEDVLDSLVLHSREGEFKLYSLDEETGELHLPRSQKLHVPSRVFFNDCMSDGRFIDYPSSFKGREGQEVAVQSCIENLRETNGSLLIARCGTGKTVMGAEIALRMQKSTCVLVHKEFLAQQWEDAFRMLSPDIRIGRMQRDVVDTGRTHDVVIAVTQSVVNPKRDYPQEFFDSFGLLICDEVHRYAATLWQSAISRFPAKYRLGLTATPQRSDGLWPVITAHISPSGPTLQADSLKPEVYIRKLNTFIPQHLWYRPWLNDNMQRGVALTALAEHRGRNEAILKFIMQAHKRNRKILVISERRSQLDYFSKRLCEEALHKSEIGFYVGGKKQADLDVAAQRSIILSTYQMAKEGLNIPDLDTLFMATPQSDIIQTVGRILRVYESKGCPIVVDFVDEEFKATFKVGDPEADPPVMGFFNPFEAGARNRQRQYKKLCYPVHN